MVHFTGNPSVEIQGRPCRSHVRLSILWQTLSTVQRHVFPRNIAHLCVLLGQVAHHYCLSVQMISQETTRLVQYLGPTTRGHGCNLTEACKNALFCCTYGLFNMMLCRDFLAPGALFCCFCLLLPLHCASEAEGICLFIGLYTIITWGLWVILQ